MLFCPNKHYFMCLEESCCFVLINITDMCGSIMLICPNKNYCMYVEVSCCFVLINIILCVGRYHGVLS